MITSKHLILLNGHHFKRSESISNVKAITQNVDVEYKKFAIHMEGSHDFFLMSDRLHEMIIAIMGVYEASEQKRVTIYKVADRVKGYVTNEHDFNQKIIKPHPLQKFMSMSDVKIPQSQKLSSEENNEEEKKEPAEQK